MAIPVNIKIVGYFPKEGMLSGAFRPLKSMKEVEEYARGFHRVVLPANNGKAFSAAALLYAGNS